MEGTVPRSVGGGVVPQTHQTHTHPNPLTRQRQTSQSFAAFGAFIHCPLRTMPSCPLPPSTKSTKSTEKQNRHPRQVHQSSAHQSSQGVQAQARWNAECQKCTPRTVRLPPPPPPPTLWSDSQPKQLMRRRRTKDLKGIREPERMLEEIRE